jgi:hypothetical protein
MGIKLTNVKRENQSTVVEYRLKYRKNKCATKERAGRSRSRRRKRRRNAKMIVYYVLAVLGPPRTEYCVHI